MGNNTKEFQQLSGFHFSVMGLKFSKGEISPRNPFASEDKTL